MARKTTTTKTVELTRSQIDEFNAGLSACGMCKAPAHLTNAGGKYWKITCTECKNGMSADSLALAKKAWELLQKNLTLPPVPKREAPRPVTVGELRTLLADMNEDTVLIMSRDPEGNEFAPLFQVSVGTCHIGPRYHAELLDDEPEPMGKTGQPCLTLWPMA